MHIHHHNRPHAHIDGRTCACSTHAEGETCGDPCMRDGRAPSHAYATLQCFSFGEFEFPGNSKRFWGIQAPQSEFPDHLGDENKHGFREPFSTNHRVKSVCICPQGREIHCRAFLEVIYCFQCKNCCFCGTFPGNAAAYSGEFTTEFQGNSNQQH